MTQAIHFKLNGRPLWCEPRQLQDHHRIGVRSHVRNAKLRRLRCTSACCGAGEDYLHELHEMVN